MNSECKRKYAHFYPVGSENKKAIPLFLLIVTNATEGKVEQKNTFKQANHIVLSWVTKKWQTMGRNKSKEPYLPLLLEKPFFGEKQVLGSVVIQIGDDLSLTAARRAFVCNWYKAPRSQKR
jgi:hypothetical protein